MSSPVFDRVLNRRQFLRATGAGGLLVAISACGDSDEASGDGTERSEIGGDLVLFTWQGYGMAEPFGDWLRSNNIRERHLGYLGINSDAITRLGSPAGRRIDITSMNTSYGRFAYEQGLTSAITTAEVPELDDLLPFFQSEPLFQTDGKFYSVPWTWGYTAITYRPDAAAEPTSYEDLFKAENEGRIATIDDFVQNVILACVALGIDPDTLTKQQLRGPVLTFMERIVRQSRTIAPGIGDQLNLLVSGDVDYMFVGLTLFDALAAEQGVTLTTVVPEEGGGGFTDGVAISANAPNRPTAVAFAQQFILPTPRAGDAQTSIFGATTHPDIIEHISEPVRELYPYDSLEAFLERIKMPAGWPTEPTGNLATFDDVLKAWQDAKGAG